MLTKGNTIQKISNGEVTINDYEQVKRVDNDWFPIKKALKHTKRQLKSYEMSS